MNEQRAAEALARWLDHPGGDPPEDVESDVREAVFALRPELAPPPRVSIDDVLDAVEGGPFAADAAEAARLARWLDDEEVPEDADDPALEAVFALRPELAAPPRVSIDDVLAGLTAGPLAGPTATQPEHTLPSSLGELPDPVRVANRVPQRARRLPAWFLPGAGALLMAALALLVVLPNAHRAPRGFPEPAASTAEAPAMEQAPTPTMAEVGAEALGERSPAQERQAAPSGGGGADGLVAASTSEPSRARDAELGPPPADTVALEGGLAQEKMAEASQGAATESWAPIRAEAPPEELPSAPATTGASALGYGDAAVAGASRDEATVAELEDADDEADASEPILAEAAEERSPRRAQEQTRSAGAKPKASATPAPAAAPSASFVPNGDDWWFTRADEALAQGDTATAERILRSLLDARAQATVKGAALRLGRLYVSQGRIEEAKTVLDRGLAAGDTPADLQASLRALRDGL